MQGSSNIRSYVFRSILLPYLSPSRPPSSAAISTSTSGNRTGNTLHTAEPINTSSRSTTRHDSTSSRKFQRAQPASQFDRNRYISSYQQVRGHDPPTITNTNTNHIERRTSSQRRSREYLGFIDNHPDRPTELPNYAETSAMALRKALQAYQPNTGEPKKGIDVKGKGRSNGERKKIDAKSIEKLHQSDDPSIAPNHSTISTLEPSITYSPSPTNPNPTLSASNTSTVSPDITPSILPPESTTISETSTSTSLTSTSNTTPTAHTHIQPFPYPPIIQKLLSARLFRLAVFHLLSTPEYATNPSLFKAIADHLEGQGAGKLAKRLRRGLELSQLGANAENGRGGRIRLYSDPKLKLKEGDKERLPNNYWQIPIVPLTELPSNTNMSKQEALTEYYNSHLKYLLNKKVSLNSADFPLSDLTVLSRNGSARGISANNQLRKLLYKIQTLERTRGFQPNRRTGNLIIVCWLRSSISPSSSSTIPRHWDEDTGWREHKDKSGNIRIVRKKYSDRNQEDRLNKVELRELFRVLSGIIESTRPSTIKEDSRITSTSQLSSSQKMGSLEMDLINNKDDPHRTELSNTSPSSLLAGPISVSVNVENQKEWEEVTRPFAKSMIRSMKHLGDCQGIELVKNWMKVQRKALLGEEED